MIKVALKHWIYDYCINVAFTNIQNNFMINNNKNKVLKLGNYYRTLGFTVSDLRTYNYVNFFHCHIISLDMDTVGFYCTKRELYLNGDFVRSHGCDEHQAFYRMYRSYLVEVIS